MNLVRSERFAALLLIAICVCFVFSPRPSVATVTSTVSFDGVWWQSMSRAEKLIAVQGMLVGYTAGYVRAASNASDATEGPSQSKFFETLVSQEPAEGDLTFGQIADRIDQVFVRHPVMRVRNVSLFVECSMIQNWDCEVTIKGLSGSTT